MTALNLLWTDVRILVVDTGRLWWRLLPQLLGVYLLGWLGFQLSLKVATLAGNVSAWLALGIFAVGFLTQLTAIVVMLRLAGRELGIAELIPDDEREEEEREDSLTHLLAVTLLPFLGIYAAFGQVQQAASRLAVEQFSRNGIFGSDQTILGVLNHAATSHPVRLGLILVAIYVVRRGVDELHERTEVRALGLLVALLESFFLLVVIMGGIRVWQEVKLWLADRALAAWLGSVRDALARVLAVFQIDLPQLLLSVGHFLSTQAWPVFLDVVGQPIVWLAVAALVYGSRASSLAELWRTGVPLGRRLPGVGRIAGRTERVAARRYGPRPVGIQRVLSELRGALFGDLDDKYLPTFHSIRLVLRAGGIFLGALVLVYALQAIAKNYLEWLLDLLAGGHQIDFWIVAGPVVDLLPNLILEPVRICLLAVAFRRCLELFRARSEAAGAALRDQPAPAPPLLAGAGT